MENIPFIPIIAVVALIVVFMFFWFVPVGLWIAAVAAGVPLRIFELIGMRLRRVNPNVIVRALISSHKAGLKVATADLEAHYLAGGNVLNVVSALIAADKARNISLDFTQAAAIDLAGRDVFEAVQISVNPRVITTPRISALALDGVELIATVRITVRTFINRLVGGAGEETIVARVGEGIISAIGASDTYEDVLENPDIITKTVLDRGLDAGTAFEILSIDIADVNVGKNIGAELQAEQAEADLVVAKAKAEEQRALAVARKQEMTANVQERRARVVEAEATVPRALAGAFREGNFDISNTREGA
ncbi:flotillin-like protein FloA [Candidatus Poribacteria bacterium]|nr:flotillin-like protein FloA [Candidatus Poribacteria bacterium]MYB65921.1 flotillin-like protein FloA [Candidatus Poribacteria bacterium]MYF56204.1 flotillin-like protein FloA [Candidatus Poribacteria bacterium]